MKMAIYALLLTALAAEAQTTNVGVNQGATPYPGAAAQVPGPAYSNQAPIGKVQLGIKLSDPPLVVAVGIGAKQTGLKMTADQQRAYVAQLKAKQDAVMAQVASMGGVELGRVSRAHNALIVSIDARSVQAIHGIAGVAAVRPVADPPAFDSSRARSRDNKCFRRYLLGSKRREHGSGNSCRPA